MIRAVASVLCAGLVLSGCSATPGPGESRAAVGEMRDAVVDTVLELVDALSSQGIEVTSAAGDYSVCGVEPSSSVEFGAGAGTTADSGAVTDQLEVIREVVREAGWDEDGTERQVYAVKGDLRVTAQDSRAEPGRLAIEVVHDCVDADRDVVDELLSEGGVQIVD